MKHWIMARSLEDAERVKVFSGGACNILDQDANLVRNEERDEINQWLTDQSIYFFDPQIHPDTHGTEYNFDVHFPLEQAVRAQAPIQLYEISPRTFGGVSALEIAMSSNNHFHPRVIFFSDGSSNSDRLPEHSREGYPLFVPAGIRGSDSAKQAHYQEMIKNGNRMRKYLIQFADELDSLVLSFSNQTFVGDVVVTPEHMHAVDMFKALVTAASGQRITVTFTGGQEAMDEKGYPIMNMPDSPRPMVFETKLREYVAEGNHLRIKMSNLIRVNVYMRIVFTQQAAKHALESLMQTAYVDAD